MEKSLGHYRLGKTSTTKYLMKTKYWTQYARCLIVSSRRKLRVEVLPIRKFFKKNPLISIFPKLYFFSNFSLHSALLLLKVENFSSSFFIRLCQKIFIFQSIFWYFLNSWILKFFFVTNLNFKDFVLFLTFVWLFANNVWNRLFLSWLD